MKRSAEQAFGDQGAGAAPSAPTGFFQPNGAAMLDPKAYFAQWQASAQAPTSSASAAAPPPLSAGGSTSSGSVEIIQQLQKLSAVRCAALVKEKGNNFTNAVAIEALHTMALKSSYKLREELVKQPHVRRLCQRILEILKRPPPTIGLPLLSKAAWCMSRFPDDVRGDSAQMLAPAAKHLEHGPFDSEVAVKLLWSMARTDAVLPHKHLVSRVVGEMVKEKGKRFAELSMQSAVDLLFAVSRARQHVHKGDHPTVHVEENDEILFDMVGKRVMDSIDEVPVQTLCDLVCIHNECGLRKEPLFKAMCPRIVANTKDIQEKTMAKVIKAYTRFMIPLRAEQQGFRTVAIVAKGDFQRPSDKPKRTGKVTFDKPQALFPKTQVHARA